jgi:hypothetical protein
MEYINPYTPSRPLFNMSSKIPAKNAKTTGRRLSPMLNQIIGKIVNGKKYGTNA